MRALTLFPTPSLNLRLLEEVLYDLLPLEGVFLHWHTHGVTATTVVPCTPGEYDLLMPLLKHAGEPVSFPRLLGTERNKSLTRSLRHSLTQQMSRLRGRLWPFGLDILCLNSYGYLLLSRSNERGEEI